MWSINVVRHKILECTVGLCKGWPDHPNLCISHCATEILDPKNRQRERREEENQEHSNCSDIASLKFAQCTLTVSNVSILKFDCQCIYEGMMSAKVKLVLTSSEIFLGPLWELGSR